jgi:mRNA-degrading endonuclease toxin of MazEF toxin-antitoxin module
MSPWEIWTYDFEEEGAHPVVIFSNAVRVGNPQLDRINVLFCTTMRGQAGWPPKPHEVILDAEDGLEWATRCRCDALHCVRKDKLRERRGVVAWERRRAICQKLLSFFPFVA